MKSVKKSLLAASISALLTACGGGGGGGTTTPPAPSTSFTLSGTVPGTLIEAFCDDGSYYSTTSDDSVPGSDHPFELELPNNLVCRLVMTTNESTANPVITQIGFVDTGASEESIAFTSDTDVDLGHIDLEMNPDPGCPGAGTYDANCDGVLDTPLEIEVESTEIEVVELVSDPMDTDRDGIINAYEDDDGDGEPNALDEDDDGDGINDIDDHDSNDNDGDGIDNENDVDDDNDGENDDVDDDDDGDGIDDDLDDDDDNDGEDDDEESEGGTGNHTTPSGDDPTAGRLLAATQCTQCHGTDGYSVTEIEGLAGDSASELTDETCGESDEPEEIMGFHGGAYCSSSAASSASQELEDIADYLSGR
ncbi:hypothetical protein BOW37_00775 [Solemya velum gill symbiont]|uniref:c-type cytochrome n=1 Tax=Solemya velum gill symbiont TaxID=2340 RepID=UPI0009982E2B|nr:hypothetical protein [Solemya velum gill symbiont]OOZ46422.1 hypothetical protein BOW37_00775 [Solemya velum gill symbiont]OOZ47246.1 hypothetical protein BOW38_04120 [Solemya velum gill symbiont]OOZ49039.1 hypothetical protein BOW39_08095 [Solemya velum gill symbiont]OOZ52348.1 hypothetical protein BOW40_03445 [Solemya velum gill symbiont]OOZ55229.1 hypothetical protein BOW41_04150 [Solemya velum gill symbiont]